MVYAPGASAEMSTMLWLPGTNKAVDVITSRPLMSMTRHCAGSWLPLVMVINALVGTG